MRAHGNPEAPEDEDPSEKTPAIQRKTNANQVNGSPGLPAWCARANSKAEPVTASVLARTCGDLQELAAR